MQEVGRISLKTLGKRKKIGLAMIMCSFLLLVPYFAEGLGLGINNLSFKEALVFSGLLVGGTVIVVMLHEGLHGIMFWLYTKRVKFGVKLDKIFWVIPYATSPGSRLQRGRLVCVALAPQIVTVILVVVSLSISPGVLPRLFFWLAMLNFAGGALDIYMSIWLFKFKPNILAEDTMDGLIVYDGV